MFRVRKINDVFSKANQRSLGQVKDILRLQFSALSDEKITQFEEQLSDPVRFRFQTVLYLGENQQGKVRGFALVMIATDLKFFYLDFIATRPGKTSSGIGGALYERIREEAIESGAHGIYFECLPDNPDLCHDKSSLEENVRRLKFYERFGARPLINTLYEMPVNPGDDCPPYLVIDPLGSDEMQKAKTVRSAVKAILERKYQDYCPPEYVQKVVASIKDPVLLRPYQYRRSISAKSLYSHIQDKQKIVLVINDRHMIHHVKDIGYVESPVRIRAILKEISKTDMFSEMPPKNYSMEWIEQVHNPKYISYFKKVCEHLEEGKSVYPYVFPIRNASRPPKDLSVKAGYYCIDTFTPLNKNAFIAAKRAVDCTLSAADTLLSGARIAYSLVRPPGHHAEYDVFGGFCYFNNNAVAAHYLSEYGKVAILDIDYHHGNGQQQIFYERADVMTISIHGHPSFAYPYFSGFAEEVGEGQGKGYNLNIPLGETITSEKYRKALMQAVRTINKFNPDFIIIAIGLDTAKGDPTGTWPLNALDFEENGRILSVLKKPMLVVQEGGYFTRSVGINARHFFSGLVNGQSQPNNKKNNK